MQAAFCYPSLPQDTEDEERQFTKANEITLGENILTLVHKILKSQFDFFMITYFHELSDILSYLQCVNGDSQTEFRDYGTH